jgi:hypothetical protein
MAGFGGVAEYGITVRWDKNFLKLARLLVERRENFAMFGGVRFGGTLTAESAFAMGFDHIALCGGRGQAHGARPSQRLARGVRTGFRLSSWPSSSPAPPRGIHREPAGAAFPSSSSAAASPPSIRPPSPSPTTRCQVEKVPRALRDALPPSAAPARCATSGTRKRTELAEEWMTHALAIRDERARARAEGREPRLLELLQSWGGSTIAYRKRLIDSPSYTLNHEEVEKALEEGIRFAENLTPMRIDVDEFGRARALV